MAGDDSRAAGSDRDPVGLGRWGSAGGARPVGLGRWGSPPCLQCTTGRVTTARRQVPASPMQGTCHPERSARSSSPVNAEILSTDARSVPSESTPFWHCARSCVRRKALCDGQASPPSRPRAAPGSRPRRAGRPRRPCAFASLLRARPRDQVIGLLRHGLAPGRPDRLLGLLAAASDPAGDDRRLPGQRADRIDPGHQRHGAARPRRPPPRGSREHLARRLFGEPAGDRRRHVRPIPITSVSASRSAATRLGLGGRRTRDQAQRTLVCPSPRRPGSAVAPESS